MLCLSIMQLNVCRRHYLFVVLSNMHFKVHVDRMDDAKSKGANSLIDAKMKPRCAPRLLGRSTSTSVGCRFEKATSKLLTLRDEGLNESCEKFRPKHGIFL